MENSVSMRELDGGLAARTYLGGTLLAGCDLDVLVVNGPSFRWAAQTLPGFADALLTGVATPAPRR